VEARNLYGAASGQGAYSLTVLAPWYRSWWGYGLELLAIAAVVAALIRWRLRLLAEQNRRLQKTVEERTAELRENNLKLTEVNSTLNNLNQEKNEFMGIAAHDLKNPLGAIRGYAEMLEEDSEDISKDEMVDTAARIKKSANVSALRARISRRIISASGTEQDSPQGSYRCAETSAAFTLFAIAGLRKRNSICLFDRGADASCGRTHRLDWQGGGIS